MCRNIRTLYHFDPPVSHDEMRAASLQFVRKVSGFNRPSAANQAAFDHAVDEVTATVHALLDSLVTTAAPKNREVEAARARARAVKRFGAVRSTGKSAVDPHPRLS
ncbi:MAG TPA: DUF2277 domain-containing protein [Gemmatimonadales bacterium]|nr:DUF2277 domain-containing protein [Gemmatimonadales bacterium]